MKLAAILAAILLFSGGASAKNCFGEVKEEVSKRLKDDASYDIDRYSIADLTQKVIGPLRGNQLTEREENEIERFARRKDIQFYQLSILDSAKPLSQLLVVDGATCGIKKRYVLLDRDEK